ncbi:MAG TPA: methyltransferase domain-containing protein [Casimicrobiaceae bacterium]|nr:methyltransferase domain-containing protein [Casimicrobiaceae bacterium]
MTLEFTGERFVPGTPGAIAYEHIHRYALARRFAQGKRVLDAACGEGYGAAQLAQVARSVCGVDISAESIVHAQARYGDIAHLRFVNASVAALPLDDASVDVVVSFETIEHLPAADQPRMLAEFARVLTDDGLLVISSPNRRRYSDERDYHNPFHLHELYRDDLQRLLDVCLPATRWLHQVPIMASAVLTEDHASAAELWIGDDRHVDAAPALDGMYYIVIAARSEAALPEALPGVSLFHDREQSELARFEATQRDVLRLDALVRERDASLAAQSGHIRHLEELVAYRERIVEERDAQLAALNATLVQQQEQLAALDASAKATQARVDGLMASLSNAEARVAEAQEDMRRIDAAIAAQERIIAYRESLRWWLQLPWVRAHSWWQRMVRS